MTEGTTEGPGDGAVRRLVASWLAWSLGGLSVTMFFAGVAFTILSLLAGTDRPTGTVGELVIFAPFLSFPIVGGPDRFEASRKPNRLGLPDRRPLLDVDRSGRTA